MATAPATSAGRCFRRIREYMSAHVAIRRGKSRPVVPPSARTFVLYSRSMNRVRNGLHIPVMTAIVHVVTNTFLKAAAAGSVRSSMRPASSSERGAHRLA